MARFDVYRPTGSPGFLLDCQPDVLNGLNTRFVVPLLPPDIAPLAGETVVMVTQFASSVPLRALGPHVESLAEEQPAIMNAIDMLLTGH